MPQVVTARSLEVTAAGGLRGATPWHQPSPENASKSVLAAVEHIGQRAVAVAHPAAASAAAEILLRCGRRADSSRRAAALIGYRCTRNCTSLEQPNDKSLFRH